MKRLIILLFISLGTIAQNKQYVDSVKALTTSKTDTVRFWAYSELAWVLKDVNKDEALKYASMLLDEASKGSRAKWVAQAYNDQGIVYMRIGDLNKALDNIEKSLAIREKLGDKKDIASSLSKIANIRTERGEYARALELQLRTLKLYEGLNIAPYIAQTCNNIGQLYNDINRFALSNAYLGRAYKLEKEAGDSYGLSVTLAVMGSNYSDLQQPDSAIRYLNEAKNLFRDVENYLEYSIACNNLGHLYRRTGDTRKGKENYLEAIRVSRQIGDSSGLMLYENNYANVLIDEGQYAEAEHMLLNSLEVSEQLGVGENILKIYQSLTGLYIHTKDAAKADLYFNKYRQLKDSVFSAETALRFSEAQTKFDVEKKDLELGRNKAELKVREEQGFVKNIIIVSIIALLLLLSVLASLFYRKKRVEQKAAMDAEIAAQKEVRIRAVIEAEEEERRRIAQDLHDGVGQLLSAAKLNLSSLEAKLKLQDPLQQDTMKNALSLVDDSVREVRAVSHNMMPNTLIRLGLASALREFITRIAGTPGLKIDLQIVGLDQRLDAQVETVLYRVIQELMNNIIRHAGASQVSMQLIRHEAEVSLVIEDNGAGFDTSRIGAFEGIGLKGILSRVEFLNGSVNFDSTPGHGTTVVVEVPLGG